MKKNRLVLAVAALAVICCGTVYAVNLQSENWAADRFYDMGMAVKMS